MVEFVLQLHEELTHDNNSIGDNLSSVTVVGSPYHF
jgi:hypothetical protein